MKFLAPTSGHHILRSLSTCVDAYHVVSYSRLTKIYNTSFRAKFAAFQRFKSNNKSQKNYFSPSGDGGGMAMFNFFNEPADESESGQNGDGQDGAGFLATLFGKGGSEEENDTQQTTNVGLFNSTFFDE